MTEEFEFVEEVPEPRVPDMFKTGVNRYSYRTKEVKGIPLFQVQCRSGDCGHWTGFYVNKRRARTALNHHSC